MPGSPIGYEPYGQGLARYNYEDGSTQLGPIIPDLVNGLKPPPLQPSPVISQTPQPQRAPGPPPLEIPKAPRGMGVSSVQVQPGVDTSEQRAAVQKGGEEVAAAQVNLANAQADALRAESDQKSAAAFGEANQVARDKEANDLSIKASAEKVDRLTSEKDAPVDPYAYGKELGIGGSFAAILAAGLVGALRAKAGQSTDVNPVVQAIHAKVQESIAMQQDERANARADRGTRLAIERERWGDAKQAGAALELRGQQAANRYFEAAAEKNRGTPLGAQGELNAAATRARIGELDAQLKQDEHGKVSVTMARLQGKAPMTLAQQLAEQEAAMKIRQAKVSAAKELGMSPEDSEKFVDEKFPQLAVVGRGQTTEQRAADDKAKTDKKAGSFSEQAARAQSALDGADEVAKAAGLKKDASGNFTAGDSLISPATFSLVKSKFDKYSNPIRNSLQTLQKSYGVAISGAGQRKDEQGDYVELTGGDAWSATELADRLNRVKEQMRSMLIKKDPEQLGKDSLSEYEVKP